jgi:hypothetical protein
MAYQLGVLAIIVVGSTALVSIAIVALLGGNLGIIAGTMVALGLLYWFSDLRTPEGFWHRVYLLFRDGVPLAPYGFRRNATLGYWLGIPLIYAGHVITAGTLYVGWELLRYPVPGVPLGIGIGFALLAYTTGIGFVESSYQLWAKRLNGVLPGDPGTSPLRPVAWSVAFLTLVFLGLYYSVSPPTPGQTAPTGTARPPAAVAAKPAALANVTLTDFLPLTYPGWAGQLLRRDDAANQIQKGPATFTATMYGGDTVNLNFRLEDAQGSSADLQLQLSESGDHLNGMPITQRSDLSNGTLKIVAHGDSQSPADSESVRMTILLRDDTFLLRTFVRQEQGGFRLRDEYRFERPTDSQ